MLLAETLPEFAQELQRLLQAQKPELAVQVPILKIVEGCGCGDDFCASFYTQPKRRGVRPLSRHDTLLLDTEAPGMLILDVVDGVISFIEVLYRPDVRQKLVALGLQL
jgi:hypothetical protein